MIDTSDILVEALTQALETSAFLTVMPSQEQPDPPQRFFQVQMHFKGPACGTLQIVAGFELGRILAQNIMGAESTDDDIAIDAIKELANVTCGLLFPMLVSSEDDLFDATLPEVQEFKDSEQWESLTRQNGAIILDVEGLPILVSLTTGQ
jgi:chemotaxis protein CheY-P-specific phosphatase CheC